MSERLLTINNLFVSFRTDDGVFQAVDDVSFHINKGEIVGLVGESGCGKSVTALSILRLIPSPPGMIEKGEIIFDDKDLLTLDTRQLRKIRGRAISMIFQEPSAAMSPLQRIGRQMTEALLLHKNITKKEAWNIAETWLEKVNISDAAERMFTYPFQLSGGMQQRIMIAMALMLGPDLVIADEPTTALDVTIQAQVFQLIKDMKQESTSILLITHDMGVIWEMCDRVLVMYASNIVEEGSVNDIFTNPAHPYTRGLLRSIPHLVTSDFPGNNGKMKVIPGQVPSPLHYPCGCRFRERCPHAFDLCEKEKPGLVYLAKNHEAACFIAEKLVNNAP